MLKLTLLLCLSVGIGVFGCKTSTNSSADSTMEAARRKPSDQPQPGVYVHNFQCKNLKSIQAKGLLSGYEAGHGQTSIWFVNVNDTAFDSKRYGECRVLISGETLKKLGANFSTITGPSIARIMPVGSKLPRVSIDQFEGIERLAPNGKYVPVEDAP